MSVAVALARHESALNETLSHLHDSLDSDKLRHKERLDKAQKSVEKDHHKAGRIQLQNAAVTFLLLAASAYVAKEANAKILQIGAQQVTPAVTQMRTSNNQARLTADELRKQKALQETQSSGQKASQIQQIGDRKAELDRELIRQVAEGMKGFLRG